jgi:hypothetical protein
MTMSKPSDKSTATREPSIDGIIIIIIIILIQMQSSQSRLLRVCSVHLGFFCI